MDNIKQKYAQQNYTDQSSKRKTHEAVHRRNTDISLDIGQTTSSTQASPGKFGGVSSYSPCQFGKGIVVHARQTYIQQTKTFTKTKLIWDNNTNCQQLYVVV